MRISELSRRSAVTPASIKYYTREGLLRAGVRTGYNQTEYDEQHVARLRLIRALLDVGGLSVAAASRVLDAIDDARLPLDAVFGITQQTSTRALEHPPTERSTARVHDLLRARGWAVYPTNPGIPLIAGVLDSYDTIDRPDLGAQLELYAPAADLVADADLGLVERSGDRDRMAETVAIGTALGDTMFAGLRRIAQENQSHRRFRPDGAAQSIDPEEC